MVGDCAAGTSPSDSGKPGELEKLGENFENSKMEEKMEKQACKDLENSRMEGEEQANEHRRELGDGGSASTGLAELLRVSEDREIAVNSNFTRAKLKN